MGRGKNRRSVYELKYYETVVKSVSLQVQTCQAIDGLMKETGKSFSEIVEEMIRPLVLSDVKFYRQLAKQAAQDVAKWQYMAKVADENGG